MSDLHTDDNIHFVEGGYKKLAECILKTLNDNGI